MKKRILSALLALILVLAGLPATAFADSYTAYTVTLYPGDGTGEPITYSCPFDVYDSLPTAEEAGHLEFYKIKDYVVGFKLNADYCPDSFTPPEKYCFDCWEGLSGVILLARGNPNQTFTAKWKVDQLKTYGPINDIPKADGGNLWLGGVKWSVIGQSNSEWLLFSTELLGGEIYWNDAMAYGDTLYNSFTALEKATVLSTSKTDGDYTSRSTDNYGNPFRYLAADLNDAKLFLPSAAEMDFYFDNDEDMLPGWSWLRSPSADGENNMGVISGGGGLFGGDINYPMNGARPMFRFDPSTVLFESAATDGKPSGSTFKSYTVPTTATDRKLTLLDSSRTGFTVSAPHDVCRGSRLDLHYSGAQTGENEYVTAMICDKLTGEPLYCASIPSEGDGDLVLYLPSDIDFGDPSPYKYYTLKVFNEQRNGDNKTDYAGAPVSQDLRVTGHWVVWFKNYDGTVLQTLHCSYGVTPIYEGKTPQKPSDDPRIDFIFDGWDPEVGPLTGDTTYTAQFREEYKYFVTFDANGGTGTMGYGTFYASEGIYTLPPCGFTAPDGQAFKRWVIETDNGDGTSTVAYHMPGARLTGLTGDFLVKAEWQPLTVRVSPANAGTAVYENGMFTATANEGYTFKEWDYYPDDSGTSPIGYEPLLSTDNPYTPESVQEGVYYAIFTANEYNLTVQANNAEWGTVTYKGTPKTNNTITLTATPNDGYLFKEWQTKPEGIAIDANNKFKMPASDVTVTAVFISEWGDVIISDEIEHGTVTADADRAKKGDTVTLTVTPDQGAVLTSLSYVDENNNETPITGNTFEMPEGSVTITATFGPLYTVTLDPGEAGGDSVLITSVDTGVWATDWISASNGQFYFDSITNGDGFRYPDNPFAWSNHSFAGWLRDGNNETDNPGLYYEAGNYTLTAQWTRNPIADGYYLIGPDWTIDAIGGAFEVNPGNENEYMLKATLTQGAEIKVVRITNDAIVAWYPDGLDNQYHVDAAHAGNVTIYFQTTYNNAWSEFGGYFYIEKAAEPSFASHSLVLSGEIGVNFFMDLSGLSDAEKEASYMTLAISGKGTVPSGNVPYNAEFMSKTGGYYGFSCYVNSIQMADTITATFHYGDHQTVSETYSVKQYIESFDAAMKAARDKGETPPYDETTENLVHALADYGHYVQPFLSAARSWMIGDGDDQYAEMDTVYAKSYDVDAIKTAVAEYAIKRDYSADIEKVTYSLLMDSDTAIYLYFKPVADYDGSFTVEGYTATKQSDGRYLVIIPNIGAHKLGDAYTVVATTTNGNTIVTVSALSYVNGILNADAYADNQTAQYAVAAIYAYYDAAIEYKRAHP